MSTVSPSDSETAIRRAARPLERAIPFALVWWVIAEGDSDSWLFGIPVIMLATVVSLKLQPTRSWRIRRGGLLRFLVFFARESVLGGVDVALRAIRPSMPLDPQVVRYSMRLGPEHTRVFFAVTVSLLPGSLSTGFEGDVLTMHLLDCSRRVELQANLREVEERVADLFDVEPGAEGGVVTFSDSERWGDRP